VVTSQKRFHIRKKGEKGKENDDHILFRENAKEVFVSRSLPKTVPLRAKKERGAPAPDGVEGKRILNIQPLFDGGEDAVSGLLRKKRTRPIFFAKERFLTPALKEPLKKKKAFVR